MNNILHNPVYHALSGRDQHLGFANDKINWFAEEVSPFVGFEDGYEKGFEELHAQFPVGRKILYAIPTEIDSRAGWKLAHEIKGLQFVYEKGDVAHDVHPDIVSLGKEHVEEMIALAFLTKPGPFNKRTIEFGHYHGIFKDNKLVAMTGQRLHPGNYTELSAVCTHPDHTGHGYAFRLLQHQLGIILESGQQPFLHVRADNKRATDLYARMGFTVSRPMNFYFMKRE